MRRGWASDRDERMPSGAPKGDRDRPLPGEFRKRAERSLGVSLSEVRMRRDLDGAAARDANAFSQGTTINLGAGADTVSLAHELVHVAQRKAGNSRPLTTPKAAEAEAEALAPRVATGTRTAGATARPGPGALNEPRTTHRRVSHYDVAGFGPAPPDWEKQFDPFVHPPDPTVDELRERQERRLASDPGGKELDGIELAQAWAEDFTAFESSERKRYRIDQLVETMMNELPVELWVPSEGAMSRSRYSEAEVQALESPNQTDPAPIRNKLFTMLQVMRGEKIDPLLPLGPIWNEAIEDLVAVEINADPLTHYENQVLWFLFGDEMKEWVRRDLAVQESVEHERQRRSGEVASGAAGGALQLIAVGSIPAMLSGIVLAAPAVAAVGGQISAGSSSLSWGVTSTAMRVAPRVSTWASQNPAYALGGASVGLNVAHDIGSGEFSPLNLPFYFGDFLMARGGASGGGGKPSTASSAPKPAFGWVPASVRNAIMAVQTGLADVPVFRGTGGSTLGVIDKPVPTLVSGRSGGLAGGATFAAPDIDVSIAPTTVRAHASSQAAPVGQGSTGAPIVSQGGVPDLAPSPNLAQASNAVNQATASLGRPSVSQTGAQAVQGQRDLGLSQAQHDPVRQGMGQPFTSSAIRALANVWDAVANTGEKAQLTFDNARRLFNNQRRRFWAAVRRDPAARAAIESMGGEFRGSDHSAPWIVLPDGTRMQITIDHIVERQTDPRRALDADNLRLSTRRENTVVLRLLHALDPFVSPPPGWVRLNGQPVQIDDIDWDRWDDDR